eukprot:3383451-Rhodomonas_salina.2
MNNPPRPPAAIRRWMAAPAALQSWYQHRLCQYLKQGGVLGTSLKTAEIIRREGFKPLSGGLLGPGTYVARADKASKFAANCQRHGGDTGAVVKVRITFTRAKYVSSDDRSWLSEGYDACRAERTSLSPYPEWCLKRPDQVEVLEVRSIACGDNLPAFEGEAMSLAVVRQKARQTNGLVEVYFNQQQNIVSFATDVDNPKSPQVDFIMRPALWSTTHGRVMSRSSGAR